MFVYGFGNYLVFIEVECECIWAIRSIRPHTARGPLTVVGMSVWFLLDVVVRIPVQVSPNLFLSRVKYRTLTHSPIRHSSRPEPGGCRAVNSGLRSPSSSSSMSSRLCASV